MYLYKILVTLTGRGGFPDKFSDINMDFSAPQDQLEEPGKAYMLESGQPEQKATQGAELRRCVMNCLGVW